MKEITIIISIILVIFLSWLCVCKFLEKTANTLVDSLEELKKEIILGNSSKSDLEQKIKEIYLNWQNTNKNWSNLVLHQETDSIETSLIRIKAKIKIGDFEESIEDIDTAIFLINHIKEKEKLSLKNIF